jgi:hypothetical protein
MRFHPLRWSRPVPDSASQVVAKARPLQWYGPRDQGEFIIEFTRPQNDAVAKAPSIEQPMSPVANVNGFTTSDNGTRATATQRR